MGQKRNRAHLSSVLNWSFFRQELRDYSQKINSLNLKMADVERRAAADREGKTTLSQQLAAFQRIENDWNRLEKEMREELKVLRKGMFWF